MITTTLSLKKELLTCPGDTIQEHIDAIGMSQAELAVRMGRSVSKLNELIKGKAPLTAETAKKLEYVLGIDAKFWLNLENIYQQELLEIEQLTFLEQCNDWIKGFPLQQLKKMRVLPFTNDTSKLVDALLKFFRIASPEEWSSIYESEAFALFKIDLRHTTNSKAISTWLRLGEVLAEDIQLDVYDKKKVTSSLPRIQEICYQHETNWLEQLQNTCASFGVALVYTPCIPKAPIYGATRWIKNKSVPLIQLSDRQKDYNAFWFSFFHELGHIRYHNKSDIFLTGIDEIVQDKEKENQADEFATNMLLNEVEREIVFKHTTFNKQVITQLSKQLRKHPSILVSQIQRENTNLYSSYSLNNLKVKVEFEELVFVEELS